MEYPRAPASVPENVKPLPFRVHFVHKGIDHWGDLLDPSARQTPIAQYAHRLLLGREIWCVQAFHLLRQTGHDVSFSATFRSDAVNVAHGTDVARDRDAANCFVACVRADRDPVFGVQVEIVQNRSSVWKNSDIYIPHWPQPGLTPRDKSRGTKLENLVFLGKPVHLLPELQSSSFEAAIARLGVKLRIQGDNWWDYTTADAVLAVRTGTPFYLSIKPASKLVNAWHAGCPAIINHEAGCSELRQGALDYLPAASVGEVMQCVERLASSPQLFADMVANGERRARAFTHETVLAAWEDALRGPIAAAFAAWNARRPGRRDGRGLADRLRQRLWGVQAIQHQPTPMKERIATLRRLLVLPRSAFPDNVNPRARAGADA